METIRLVIGNHSNRYGNHSTSYWKPLDWLWKLLEQVDNYSNTYRNHSVVCTPSLCTHGPLRFMEFLKSVWNKSIISSGDSYESDILV